MFQDQSRELHILKSFTLDSKYEGLGNIIHVPTLGVWYDHDKVLHEVEYHYKKLGCWETYGRYTSSKNVPKLCQPFVQYSKPN